MHDIDLPTHDGNEDPGGGSFVVPEAALEWQYTVDALPDVVLILDSEFRIARCNVAAMKYFGMARDQIEGHLCWELTHGTHAPHPQCPVITMQKTRRRERAVIQMNGGHYEITADPIFDNDGGIRGVVHIISDVSDRIRTINALTEAHLLYQDIIDNQSAGIYRIRVIKSGSWADVANPPYCYEFLNDRYMEITGLSRDELMADPSATMKLVHPEDLAGWIYLNQRADRTLEVFQWEGRFIVSGKTKWIHYESRPRVLSNGDRVWTGVLLDLSELKTTRDKLLETEAMLSKVNANLQGGLIYRVIREPDGRRRFTYLGGAVEKFYGVTGAEAIMDPSLIYGRVHPEEIDRLKALEEEANSSLSVFRAVVRMVAPDGSTRWSSFVSSPTALPEGVTCWDGIETDITELKNAEQALRDSEEALHHAEKMQAIGQLAGGVAHDFNNQLLGIMGYAEMIFHNSPDPEIKEFATNIISASRRSSDLTRKLLAFSRKGKYRDVPVAVHDLISEVIKLLEHSVDRKIKICREFKARRCVISGDPTQIQNALLNLAINARDAMPGGGEILFLTDNMNFGDVPGLRVNRERAKGECIRIAVKDNGQGMSAETMKHVFEPFFTTKPAEKGSGMGLASVYGTVKSHKGYIFAESEPGKGSVFSIYLPVADVPVSSDDFMDRDENSHGKKLRILLADDDEVVRKMLSRMLASFGHEVVIACDGNEAVELYSNSFRSIDLVLLDMVMPGLNGKEAFFEMQKLNRDIRALMISGFSIDGEVQKLLKSGLKGFLQKPFEVSVLSKKIAEVMVKS